MLKSNNLFNFGLENFTKMKRPAKLVKPATVYLCIASVSQSHLIFNRIEKPLNLFPKKNCKASKQQPFSATIHHLCAKPETPRRTCAAEQFLSPFPGCNLACEVS